MGFHRKQLPAVTENKTTRTMTVNQNSKNQNNEMEKADNAESGDNPLVM